MTTYINRRTIAPAELLCVSPVTRIAPQRLQAEVAVVDSFFSRPRVIDEESLFGFHARHTLMVGAIGFVGVSAPGHAEHSDDERQSHQCRLHPIRALNRAVFTGEASLRLHG